MKRVLFINMPFGGLDRPALGISLLKAALQRDGIAADIAYFNHLFADMLGLDMYKRLSNCLETADFDTIPYTALAGDWIFSQAYYGLGRLDADGYVRHVLREYYRVRGANVSRIMKARSLVPPFLERCLGSIRWDEYSLVGLTSTFEQTLASLCLARLIRSRYPHVLIAFGGANCEGCMGEELHRQYPFIDFVSTGEADESFPALVRALRTGRTPDGIKGIIWRRGQKSVNNGPIDPVTNLDDIPYPDFDDYFFSLRAGPLAKKLQPWLQVQASRGCWWGEKNQCAFCGLNGSNLAFRSKSPSRVLAELLFLSERYDIDRIAFVDNIFDGRYFETLLPELARRRNDLHLFCEVKSNLGRHELRALRESGVGYIQVGIESLSTPILRLMGKGTTALQNVALLKWCHSQGIAASWNLLYGLPKEDPSQYAAILEILKRIVHLRPPDAIGAIRLDRFSPNYNEAARHGFLNVRPSRPYRHVYPFESEALSRICYFFEFDYPDHRRPDDYADAVNRFWHEWLGQRHNTVTHARTSRGAARILDARSNRIVDHVALDAVQNAIYEFCDVPRHIKGIHARLCRLFPKRDFQFSRISAFLDYLIEAHLMVREGAMYLSVVPTENSPLSSEWS
ncbi:MAG: RiPP maturation radical SAM protein 1 [Elusimicrobia bacterium]|nr:RiPP maturation radical SAM protein 1 [Elusimicrobiota bacterium]